MQAKHYPIAILLAAITLVASLYLNTLIVPAAPLEAKNVVAGISADRYMKHLTFLASDEMKGRGDGSPELNQAADYIASQFRVWGMKPAGENGTYFQNFE